MLSRNCLGISTPISLGLLALLAGCSGESSTTSATNDLKTAVEGAIEGATENTNVCLYDGYSAMQGATGEILCMDAAGNLAFWINTDGSYGFPEAAQGTTTDPATGYSSATESGVVTTPTSDSTSTGAIESSASATGSTETPSSCTDSKALYTINGVSYYQSAQGYIYYFDEACNRIKVETAASSSSVAQPIESSDNNQPTVSSSSITPIVSSSSSVTPTVNSSSATTVTSNASTSNGNTPTIKYASASATLENDNGCVSIDGGTVTITCAGDYYFNGNGNGQIQVNAASTDKVELYLNNLTLSNSNDAPLYVRNADKVVINLESGTTNTFSDASSRTTYYTKADGTKDTTGAAIYAKDDLTIKGEGTLKVTGNYNNGIHSSNDLRVRGNPTINVTAKNNGLKGKGLVDIEGGDITISATSGDGIKSDECTVNGSDTTITDGKGIVDIKGGKITITKAGDDGIQAYNYIIVRDSVSTPTINVTSTGKGIVSENRVYINAGKIDISSGDDGVHSNMNIYFNGGYTTIAAPKNDGVHADSTLTINDGTIYVTNSYEGLEAWYIKANGGITDVYGTDDAWNAAGGNDGSGNTSQGGQSNWGFGPGGSMGGGMGSSSGFLTITGGVHHAKTGSGDTDGIDSNGELTISGGVVIVECQISGGMGGSFDADGSASLTSKTVLGFSSGSSEKGSNYSVSFSTSSYYGTSNVAFKPTISGRYMVTTTGQPSQISNVSSYSKNVTFPSGSTVYYNE